MINFEAIRRKYPRRQHRQAGEEDRLHIGPPPWRVKSDFQIFCEQFASKPGDDIEGKK
jgi:hypothetical protein